MSFDGKTPSANESRVEDDKLLQCSEEGLFSCVVLLDLGPSLRPWRNSGIQNCQQLGRASPRSLESGVGVKCTVNPEFSDLGNAGLRSALSDA